jgi:D-3-phosphoglycerate dehydrogenase
MKPSALLLNTSRGRVVDEYALLEALKERTIAGAGLDVIDGEWLNDDKLQAHPLLEYARANGNLLITPHIGGATSESIYGARVFMARRVADYLQAPENAR